MAKSSRKKSGLWGWVVIAVIIAALAVGTLYYIGWFDNRTHVDTPAGDNIERQYDIDDSKALTPEEAGWQNADSESFREAVVDPEIPTQTPPGSETPTGR